MLLRVSREGHRKILCTNGLAGGGRQETRRGWLTPKGGWQTLKQETKGKRGKLYKERQRLTYTRGWNNEGKLLYNKRSSILNKQLSFEELSHPWF